MVPELSPAGSTMKPLMGTEEAIIDAKGRLLLSKKKRERLGESFVIAVGHPGCLAIYPEKVWDGMLADIMQYESINDGRQQFTRLVLGLAEDELSCDGQGRVVIPQKLRELAKLTKEVLIIGCGERAEIWAKEEWEKYNENPDTYGQQRRNAIAKALGQMKGTV